MRAKYLARFVANNTNLFSKKEIKNELFCIDGLGQGVVYFHNFTFNINEAERNEGDVEEVVTAIV